MARERPNEFVERRFLGLRGRIASVTREVQEAMDRDGAISDALAGKIRGLRVSLGLRVEDMAVVAQVDEKTVFNAENNTKPSERTLLKYLRALERCVEAIQQHPNRTPDWIEFPIRGWSRQSDGESRLLDPELRVVGFHGEARIEQLNAMVSWCQSDTPTAIQSFQALGGMGKTRLGIELCIRLADLTARQTSRPWICGFLNAETFLNEPKIWEPWNLASRNLLLIVDYAGSAHNLAALERLLPRLDHCPSPNRRLLLLDRTDRFLAVLKRHKECGPILRGDTLQRKFSSPRLAEAAPPSERTAIFKSAAAAFKKAMGSTESVAEPPNLKHADFEKVLLLHMAALLAIGEREETMHRSKTLLDAMLDRERRLWERQLESHQMPAHLLLFVERAYRLISMAGGARTEVEAMNFADRDPYFSKLSIELKLGILEVLADLYQWGNRYIAPLTPDLLGERFAGKTPKVPKAIRSS